MTKKVLTEEEMDMIVGGYQYEYGGYRTLEEMPATPEGCKIYQIQPGDTLNKIAAKYGLTADELAKNYNSECIDDINKIAANAYIFVPNI